MIRLCRGQLTRVKYMAYGDKGSHKTLTISTNQYYPRKLKLKKKKKESEDVDEMILVSANLIKSFEFRI